MTGISNIVGGTIGLLLSAMIGWGMWIFASAINEVVADVTGVSSTIAILILLWLALCLILADSVAKLMQPSE
jgi:hypothetical protein